MCCYLGCYIHEELIQSYEQNAEQTYRQLINCLKCGRVDIKENDTDKSKLHNLMKLVVD
jgi:hypothetical protein